MSQVAELPATAAGATGRSGIGTDAVRRLIGRILSPRSIAVAFCLQAMLAVVLLTVLVPPFENSDEIAHFQRVDQISRGGLIGRHLDDPHRSGGRVDPGIAGSDYFLGIIRFHNGRKVDQAMLRGARSVRWGKSADIEFTNTAIYPPVLYLPAVAGVWIGKAARLPIATTLVLSRVLSGASCVLMAATAIAFAGDYALFLATLLSLPMSLSLFAAVSQDGPMLAMAALSVALVRRIRDAPAGDRTLPELWWLSASLALLITARPAYAPFVILPLLLPRFRLMTRLLATGIATGCVAIWSLCAALLAVGSTSLNRNVVPSAQIVRLLLHPDLILPLMARTMAGRQGMEGQSFFREMVGVLGWIDVVLPGWFYGSAAIVLALAVFCAAIGHRPLLPGWRSGVMALAAAASVGLVFLLIYATWSPLGFPVVDGVQGRYFLPIALLLPACLPAGLARADRLVVPVRLALLLFPIVSITVTVAAVVTRYYVAISFAPAQ